LSIPVAVGPRRVGGKSGADCVSYDTVVNDVVLEEIEKDVSGGYRDFVCQLVMEYVEQKIRKPKENGGEGDASATVDKRYKLPKVRCDRRAVKGEIRASGEQLLCIKSGLLPRSHRLLSAGHVPARVWACSLVPPLFSPTSKSSVRTCN